VLPHSKYQNLFIEINFLMWLNCW